MFNSQDNEQATIFFSRLSKRMRNVSSEWRDEQIKELRQHLEDLVSSRLENGGTLQQAVEAAIASLGNVKEIGRRLRQEYQADRSVASIEPGLNRAFACFGVITIIHLVTLSTFFFAQSYWQSDFSSSRHSDWLSMIAALWPWYLIFVLFLGSPILAGWLTGSTGLHRVGVGSACALGATSVLLIILSLTFEPLVEARDNSAFWQGFHSLFSSMSVAQLVWIPIGCSTAVMTSRAKNRRAVAKA